MTIEAEKIGHQVGTTWAEMTFGLGTARNALLLRLLALDPFATRTFTISNRFNERTKPVLTQAVSGSNLPEDVYVATPEELDGLQLKPDQRFVVVSVTPKSGERLTAYQKGAMRYVIMDWNVQALTQSLNGERQTQQ